MANDQAIVDDVHAALDNDPGIANAAEVAVAEQAGTVTLRGRVRSFQQRRTAIELARSIPGVQDVRDELRVDPRDRYKDEEIRAAALQALIDDDDAPADQIDVAVAKAWVTLKGTVQHQPESDAAFYAVARVPGVGGITNAIKVVTAGER